MGRGLKLKILDPETGIELINQLGPIGIFTDGLFQKRSLSLIPEQRFSQSRFRGQRLV